MGLAASSVALGVNLAAASGSVDPVGILRWSSIASAMGIWFPANSLISSAPGMSGAAGVVSGTGPVTFTASNLGVQMAQAAGSVDAAGISAWTNIGAAILAHCTAYGLANGTGLTYTPGAPGPPVPVVGAGTFSFTNSVALGVALAAAAPSVDAAGIVAWNQIASAMLAWLATAQVLPTLILVPPNGGPCVGTGTLL